MPERCTHHLSFMCLYVCKLHVTPSVDPCSVSSVFVPWPDVQLPSWLKCQDFCLSRFPFLRSPVCCACCGLNMAAERQVPLLQSSTMATLYRARDGVGFPKVDEFITMSGPLSEGEGKQEGIMKTAYVENVCQVDLTMKVKGGAPKAGKHREQREAQDLAQERDRGRKRSEQLDEPEGDPLDRYNAGVRKDTEAAATSDDPTAAGSGAPQAFIIASPERGPSARRWSPASSQKNAAEASREELEDGAPAEERTGNTQT